MRALAMLLSASALLVTAPAFAQLEPTPVGPAPAPNAEPAAQGQSARSQSALDAAVTAAAPALERCAAAAPAELRPSLAALHFALDSVPGRPLRASAVDAPASRPGSRLVSCAVRALVHAAGRAPRGADTSRVQRNVAPFEGRSAEPVAQNPGPTPTPAAGSGSLPSDLTAGCQSAADCELVCNVPPSCCPGCGCNSPVLRRHVAAVESACSAQPRGVCPALDCQLEVRTAACVAGHCRAVTGPAH